MTLSLRKYALIALLLYQTTAIADEDVAQPSDSIKHFNTVTVFGDSLSDSHGDDFRSPAQAFSTYNLLRTFRGYVDTETQRPPLDLSQFFSSAASIQNIKTNFELYRYELAAERRTESFIGKLVIDTEKYIVDQLEEKIIQLLDKISYLESEAQQLLPVINESISFINTLQSGAEIILGCSTNTILKGLNNKLIALKTFIGKGAEDVAEEAILEITKAFDDMIPLIPDPQHYETGRWTTGKDMDLMWPQVLVKMMSAPHRAKVHLDNRAMAGSWVLCAEGKLGNFGSFLNSVDGAVDGIKTLFQGSFIPPCEGLIVQSYLNERREEKKKLGMDKAKPITDNHNLFIFFNGGNDFLNNWDNPDDVAQEHAQDIWNLLHSGASRVAVITLPDISVAPRFQNTSFRKSMHAKWEIYDTSLRFRLNLLREEFGDINGNRLFIIDGQEIFVRLKSDARWDFENPILDIPIPGMDSEATRREDVMTQYRAEAKDANNLVRQELLENAAFEDVWQEVRGKFNKVTKEKTAFFSDSVHPSAEAHYAIAELACEKLSQNNIYCDPQNYTKEQAISDSLHRKAPDKEEL